MKPGGGGPKGAEFERHCCKRMSLYVTGGARDDVFWRTAISGGRATLQLRRDIKNLAQSGDMTAISREGYELCESALFEYKSYAKLDIPEGLLKGTGHLVKFWRATQKAAKRYGKTPVMIAKQNYLPVMILTELDCRVFTSPPIMTLHRIAVNVRLFDEATAVIKPKPVRLQRPVAVAKPERLQRPI